MTMPAGAAAKGYKATTFHGVGADYGAIRDILKYVSGASHSVRRSDWPAMRRFLRERLGDHLADAFATVAVEVCGVDQAGGVDPADARSTDIVRGHTAVLPGVPSGN